MTRQKLRLGRILDISTVDYPGKLASVIFLHGCNFRCPFCFNFELVASECSRELHVNDIAAQIKRFRDFVDAVVLTGGEPTLQPIDELCKEIKNLGLLVKIDTNGTNPDMIDRLIKRRLIDFVALDIKAPFKKYPCVVGVKLREHDVNNVKKTFDLLVNSNIEYECRMPVVPNVNKQYIKEVANEVKKAKVFVLEQFWSEKGTLGNIKGDISREELINLASHFSNKIIKIRTREEGEEIIRKCSREGNVK